MENSAESFLDIRVTFRDRLRSFGRLLWRDRIAVIGIIIFLSVAIAALFAPQLTPYKPLDQDLYDSKLPPAWIKGGSWEHPLGTDNLGRDLFSRIIYGARVSLGVSFFGAIIAATIGVVLGALAAYGGKGLDEIIMAPVNLVLSLPYLLFVVFVASVLGRSLINVILIFGITNSPILSRYRSVRSNAHPQFCLYRVGGKCWCGLVADFNNSYHAKFGGTTCNPNLFPGIGDDIL